MLACEDCPLLTEIMVCSLSSPSICSSPAGWEELSLPTGVCASPKFSHRNTQSQPACLLGFMLGVLRKAILKFLSRHQRQKGARWLLEASIEQRLWGPTWQLVVQCPVWEEAMSYTALPWQTRPQGQGDIPARPPQLSNNDSLVEHRLWAFWG